MSVSGGLAFPAYAGMNRRIIGTVTISARVPRVCGDEPCLE